MNSNVKKSFTPIFFGLLFLLLLSISFFWLYESKVFVSRADTKRTYAPDNFNVFVTPITATPNGDEKIRMYGFLLNGEGLGVKGIPVVTSNSNNVTITPVQSTTDDAGEFIFDASSTQPGSTTVSFTVNNVLLPKSATVTFR